MSAVGLEKTLELKGQLRSYNQAEGGANHLHIRFFVQELQDVYKRQVSMVLALLLAAMLLASCAGGNGDADEGTAEPGESSVPVGENGEIRCV